MSTKSSPRSLLVNFNRWGDRAKLSAASLAHGLGDGICVVVVVEVPADDLSTVISTVIANYVTRNLETECG